ncbi:MAG: hypothetical protein ACI4RH_00185 [Huintestinicola sp.]
MFEIIIIGVILGLIALILAAPFIAIYKIKKKKYLQGIVSLVIYVCIAAFAIVKSGVLVHTGASGNRFTYKNSGTSSMGSYAVYYLDDPSVLIEEKKLDYRIIPNSISFGHRFRAINSGECDLIVWEIDCASVAYVDVYHITVDKDLKCSYEHQRPDTALDLNSLKRMSAVRYNGAELVGQKARDFYNNLICLYGENKECEEPSEDYPEMEFEVDIDWESPPNTAVQKYYIKDENTFYYQIRTYKHNENGKVIYDENGEPVTVTVWYEFTKDPRCKNSLIDVWEMSE